MIRRIDWHRVDGRTSRVVMEDVEVSVDYGPGPIDWRNLLSPYTEPLWDRRMPVVTHHGQ